MATCVVVDRGGSGVSRGGWIFLETSHMARIPLGAGLAVFVGALEIQLRNTQQLPGAEILAFADGNETIVTAHVRHEGEIRDGSYGGSRQSIDAEIEQIEPQGVTRPIRAGLRLGIYTKESDPDYAEDGGSSPMRSFRYGERLRFQVKLRAPRNFRNPGAFDYQGYLADNGIVVLGARRQGRPIAGIRGNARGEVARTDSSQHRAQDPRTMGGGRCGPDGCSRDR